MSKENALCMEAEYFRVRKSLTLITLTAPEYDIDEKTKLHRNIIIAVRSR